MIGTELRQAVGEATEPGAGHGEDEGHDVSGRRGVEGEGGHVVADPEPEPAGGAGRLERRAAARVTSRAGEGGELGGGAQHAERPAARARLEQLVSDADESRRRQLDASADGRCSVRLEPVRGQAHRHRCGPSRGAEPRGDGVDAAGSTPPNHRRPASVRTTTTGA